MNGIFVAFWVHGKRKTISAVLHLNTLIINSGILKKKNRKSGKVSVHWCPNKICSASQFMEEFLI